MSKGSLFHDHLPSQVDHVLPWINFQPQWLLDCGPGSGVECVKLKLHWPEMQVLGLEPSPVGYMAAAERWPKGGILLDCAVWSYDGTIKLCRPEDLLHSSCFSRSEDDPGNWVEVRTRSLDSLDSTYGPFKDAILWMDIEGAELEALAGAKDLLSRRAIRLVNVETRPGTEEAIASVLSTYGLRRVHRYFECQTYWDDIWSLDKDQGQ